MRRRLCCWLLLFKLARCAHVEISFGTLEGNDITVGNRTVNEFLGIPYAQPPIHDLRWERPSDWGKAYQSEGFDATSPGAECIQRAYNDTSQTYLNSSIGSEDCLFLNVWAAAQECSMTLPCMHNNIGDRTCFPLQNQFGVQRCPAGTHLAFKQDRPVLFWIHGGSFQVGSGSDYNGTWLALKHDCVVVTINYRLGSLGFLAIQDFTTGRTRSNFGLLDQHSALRFVKREVASFGGDSSKITIFGESAGAISVQNLLLMPSADGLFSHAISESGMPTAWPLHFAVSRSANFTQLLGCDCEAPEYYSCLRGLSAADISAAQVADLIKDANPFTSAGWSPSVDGRELRDLPIMLFTQGKINPSVRGVIFGTNTNESTMFVNSAFSDGQMNQTQYVKTIEKMMNSHGTIYNSTILQRIFDMYPCNLHSVDTIDAHNCLHSCNRMVTDGTFMCGSKNALLALSANNAKSKHPIELYHYRWNYRASLDHTYPESYGIYHTAELPFVWEPPPNRHGSPDLPWLFPKLTESEIEFGNRIGELWAHFALHGKPSSDVLGEKDYWPRYDTQTQQTVLFEVAKNKSNAPLTIKSKEEESQCKLWLEVERIASSS